MVKRIPALRPVALLLALGLMLLGAWAPHAFCAGACCSADGAAASAWDGRSQGFEEPHACCCETGARPCDLQEAPARDLPDSAVSAVPRVEPPAPVTSPASPLPVAGAALAARPIIPLSPSAQGPPGPLYLLTQAFLC